MSARTGSRRRIRTMPSLPSGSGTRAITGKAAASQGSPPSSAAMIRSGLAEAASGPWSPVFTIAKSTAIGAWSHARESRSGRRSRTTS